MTGEQETKPGPGRGVWIALGILGVMLVVAIAGSRNAPLTPESVSQEVKTLAVAPSVEAELPAKEPLPENTKAPISDTAKSKTAVAMPAEKTVMETGGNLVRTLKLGMQVVEAGDGEKVLPLDYTCYRANKSPALQWAGLPAKTKSFAVLLERREKDRPAEIKWAVFNVPANAKGLPANLPKQAEVFKDGTAQAQNDQGYAQYVGPCDAQGRVNYVFRLFALDQVLNIAPGAPGNDLTRAMNGHVVDEADLAVIHYFRIK